MTLSRPRWLRAGAVAVAAVAAMPVAACSQEPRSDAASSARSTPASPAPTDAPVATPAPPTTSPIFRADIQTIDAATAARMSASWRSGCPVPLDQLRLIKLVHWGFDGNPRDGELVVHANYADEIVSVFDALYGARFPIEQIRLVDEFGADDDRSMAANNTSAFNCRPAYGSQRWSEHAYGRAIDINPVQNPYVTRSGEVLPPAGRAYTDRSSDAPGLVTAHGPVTEAFTAIGWGWGGTWSSGKDYQHFSASGR